MDGGSIFVSLIILKKNYIIKKEIKILIIS